MNRKSGYGWCDYHYQDNANRELKLFVFDLFGLNWSFGLAFAIAETVEEAKQMIGEPSCGEFGEYQEFPLTHKIAFACEGGS